MLKAAAAPGLFRGRCSWARATPRSLANLVRAPPPAADPRRRIAALTDLDGALGRRSPGRRALARRLVVARRGNAAEALVAFDKACGARDDDLAAWEGLRAAGRDHRETRPSAPPRASSSERAAPTPRAARCSGSRGRFLWIELGAGSRDELRGETALAASFARDAKRSVAFDKLFRRVRERKDGEKLLTLIARRLKRDRRPDGDRQALLGASARPA